MRRTILVCVAVTVCLTAVASHAARQTQQTTPRLNFKIGISPTQQPRLLLPESNTIEFSALSIERDEANVMHLKGAAEIRFALPPAGLHRAAVIRTDEATYNVSTAEIQVLSAFTMTEERVQ
jgi:hypothetical protein